MRAAHRDHAQSRFFSGPSNSDNPPVPLKGDWQMRPRLKKLESKFLAVLMLAGPATVLSAAAAPAKSAVPVAAAHADGVVKQKSDYGFEETIVRIKADIDAKGIRFFDEIDQAGLGDSAKLPINRSTLLLFGNPPLGVQFLQSNPVAGLDWPVRMLVTQDDDGSVWVSWTDFNFVAGRYQLRDRDPQIKMASEVAASIASAARKQQ
jgi:uncharacterized protein (DUF302 family)